MSYRRGPTDPTLATTIAPTSNDSTVSAIDVAVTVGTAVGVAVAVGIAVTALGVLIATILTRKGSGCYYMPIHSLLTAHISPPPR